MSAQKMMMMTSAEAVESADDLLVEILSKLPLRSLARFKFVSRRWQSIIVSWVFLLLRKPNPSPSAVGLFVPSGLHTYKYLPLDPKTQKDPPFTKKLPFHDDDPSWPIWIHQSCNGLLLCCSSCKVDNPRYWQIDHPIGRCYVYNPTTKDLSRIPMPVVSAQTFIVAVNLAFDPSKSPFYKAVCLRASHLCPNLLHAQIYSVESNAWISSRKPVTMLNTFGLLRHGVYWNGSVHWLDYWAYEIVYFNVDDGRLRKIRLPAATNNLRCDAIREGYFGESCGRLHVIPWTPSSLNVYEMKEDYSDWLVKYEVRTTEVYPGISRFKAVLSLTHGGHEQGGSFLVMLMSDRVVRYDLVTRKYGTIFHVSNEFEINLISSYGLRGFQYIESAALVI